jgi:hypothetical protein
MVASTANGSDSESAMIVESVMRRESGYFPHEETKILLARISRQQTNYTKFLKK